MRAFFVLMVSVGLFLGCHQKLEVKKKTKSTGTSPKKQQDAKAIEVDPTLPEYQKVEGVSGNLNSVGSDTLNNLMTFWAEGFRKIYPNVKIQIEGKGSSTAPPALIAGTAQLGPMSRPMKREEKEAFEKKWGVPPSYVAVALDGVAIYVHRDNPLEKLSLVELDAIFSKTRRGGYPKEVRTWGDLGLTGEWKSLPISLYGRNSASGTYGYFKKHALFKGDFKNTVKEQPGSSSVVNGVANDRGAIGYSGIGYRTPDVKLLALSRKPGEQAYLPTYENILKQRYPLSRYLYIYFVKLPNKPLDKLVREFLKFVLSKEGQKIVIKGGYLPLTREVVEKERKKLED